MDETQESYVQRTKWFILYLPSHYAVAYRSSPHVAILAGSFSPARRLKTDPTAIRLWNIH